MSMDKYDPIRILGEGSFGKVYLMRDKVRRTFVCVKVIKIKNIPKKEREATKMEVDLLRRLHHPNIVRYIDSFLSKNNESLCICMEYCDGGDLASQIKAARRNMFGESKILHWFVQLALGLHYMHTNKVLHRDLKTQNVFLLGNGRLVLGDLGISKVLDGTMDFAQTCIGTPYYMSPEIFQNKPYSYKSDVWALGCVLYEMTTLNHAFDANSLNGLAGKIVKGRYPPINAKYSKHLADLIAQMLSLSPQQRPDMDQILRKPFIKKHIVNFFSDIAARPSAGVGEGTMIVRAAAGAASSVALNSDSNVIALQKQLHVLDMTQAVQEALAPKEVPVDALEAKKFVKEQAGALRREKEHKQMVEVALEKLRLERENRSKLKQQQALGGGPSSQLPSSRRDDGGKQPAGAAYRQPSPTPFLNNQQQQQPKPRVSDAVFAPNSAVSQRDRYSQQPAGIGAGGVERRISGKGAVDAAQEESRRRDEDRTKAREDERLRYEAHVKEEVRLRDEAATKQKADQLQAQADAVVRRDQLRERERARQREEIDQLKRDKIELDRRSNERDRQREERREEERRKLEDGRRLNEAQDKASSSAPSKNGNNNHYPSRVPTYEDKEASAWRQDKMARDALDRAEALRAARAAEEENRRQRAIANSRLYTENGPSSGSSGGGVNNVPVSSVNRYNSGGGGSNSNRAEQEARSKASHSSAPMPTDELAQKLSDATQGVGRGNRYASGGGGNDSYAYAPTGPGRRNIPTDVAAGQSGYSSGTATDDEGDDTEVLWSEESAVGQMAEEEEDMRRREDELKEELSMATLRCDQLKRTLQETKSFIDPKDAGGGGSRTVFTSPGGMAAGPSGGASRRPPAVCTIVSTEDEDGDEEEDEDEEEYDDNDEEQIGSMSDRDDETPSKRPLRSSERERDDINGMTPRMQKPVVAAVKQSPYYGLQDAPSPVGRLSDRIERLRQRCIDALGRDAFAEAHGFLKHFEESHATDGRSYEEDVEEEKIARMRDILGEGKAHYMPLIEQLLFMEDTLG